MEELTYTQGFQVSKKTDQEDKHNANEQDIETDNDQFDAGGRPLSVHHGHKIHRGATDTREIISSRLDTKQS